MTKTENYQLNQWDLEDRVVHTDFNEDNAKLDAALKAQADALKAENAAWGNAVAVEAQARRDADTAEAKARQEAITAEAQARQALAAQVTKCGNCKIVLGQYTGKGTYGYENPNKLTFPQKPLLVLIQLVSAGNSIIRMSLVQGCTSVHGNLSSTGGTSTVIWSGNSVSWYSNSASNQCNTAAPYIYLAFLAMDE